MGTIKTVWQMSGEKEYKQAIADINRGLGVLNTEMKKVSAQYETNAGSVEALTAKNDVLERTISTQREKVDALRAALQKSAENYGESDRRTMEWQKSLNKAEADLYKTEHALRENEDALRDAQRETEALEKADDKLARQSKNLGDALDDVAGKFGISLPNGAKNALNSLGGVSGVALGAVGAFGALAAGVVAAEKKMIGITKEAAATADNIITLSKTTHLSTDTIQEMMYASNLLDVSFDTISGSLTKLTNNMQSARDGNAGLQETFDSLGVAVADSDGNLRNAEEVFYELIDALGEMENGTERDALAMDIFGKSAQDLNPLIEAGSEALSDMADEAHDVGYVMSGEALDGLNDVDDAYQRIQLKSDTFKQNLAAEFAPYATEALEKVENAVDKIGDAFTESGAGEQLGDVLEKTIGLIEPVGDLAAALAGPFKIALEGVSGLLEFTANTLQLIADAIDAIPRAWEMMQTYGWKANTDYANAPVQGPQNLGSYYARKYAGGNASGTDFWRGGLTWVGENGPELVRLPAGSAITSASESRSTGGDVFNISIDASSVQEFNDIVRIARTARMRERMGNE